jgi:plastocyanin
MKRGLLMVSILAVLMLVMAACASPAATPAATETTAVTPTPAGAAGGSGTIPVSITSSAYNPATVTIKAGQTVEWTNDDSTTHTVTSLTFDSGPIDPGKKFAFTFHDPGTVDYADTLHPNIKGQVIAQ